MEMTVKFTVSLNGPHYSRDKVEEALRWAILQGQIMADDMPDNEGYTEYDECQARVINSLQLED